MRKLQQCVPLSFVLRYRWVYRIRAEALENWQTSRAGAYISGRAHHNRTKRKKKKKLKNL